jgi:gliding motility-associated-like protein
MKLSVYFFLFLLPSVLFCQTTNISGIINSYASVSAIGSQSVSVSSVAGFNVGDRVLLLQMKGASINTSNNTSFGNITGYNDAGNYEFVTIASISGTALTFVNPIIRTYTSTGFVQLVKVPTYTNVNVSAPLTCSPWNGTIGGVLVFEASGTITLNADIDVSGNGFLGGVLSSGAITGCAADTFDYVLPSTTLAAGRKGEGIVNPNLSMSNGKGAWANGGGSGNDCNGGGAGGGNFGMGGHGGDSKVNVSCPTFFYQNSGGYPAKNLIYSNSTNKIFLGGGGGCGHQNDGAGTPGTSGGAIVLLRGTSLTGNSHFIKSNGTDNNLMASIDGQGGGGAGGTVLLDVCSINSLNVSAKGGKGGIDNFGGSDCHGKGGGGSGGVIWVSSSLSGVTSVLTGGLPGVFTSSGSLCFNNSNGATAGQAGGTLTGLVIPGTSPMYGASFVKDTVVCLSNTVLLNAPSSSSYTWSTGSNNQSVSVNNTGNYWVQEILPNGCLGVDTFKVKIVTPSQFNIISDTTICNSNSVVLNASVSGASSYTWSTGSNSYSISVNNNGIYWVDMQIAQCLIKDSAKVTFANLPGIVIDTFLCNTNVVALMPSVLNAALYNWSTGAHSNTIVASSNGTYWVDVQIGQCFQRDSFLVNFISKVDVLKDTIICGTSLTLDVSQINAINYEWSTGETNPSINVVSNGIYWVDLSLNQCMLRDSATIYIVHPPKINLTKDTFICISSITLEVTNPNGTLTWFNGSHLNQVSVSGPGTYSVSINDSGCVNTKSVIVTQMPGINSLVVPNIFTPNGDGLNDFFELSNAAISIKEFTIYNRWGKLVYSISNSSVKWDGKQNASIVDDDTYFWVATFNDLCDSSKKDSKQRGFITLVK